MAIFIVSCCAIFINRCRERDKYEVRQFRRRQPSVGGCYDTAGRLTRDFETYCSERGIHFTLETSVRPPDDTTLFCSSGMQRHKPLFSNPEHTGTIANIQTCLRLSDLDEVGDATHYLTFRMMGLFSFRDWTMQQAVDFWLGFLERIGLPPDHVTIHPDKLDDWSPLYRGRFPIVPDPDCTWSDGAIQGYCTEFYVRGVEIGNIVNPLGTCIDVGFGLERIANLLEGAPIPSVPDVLTDAIETIIASGYRPGPNGQGYVLRKLLRLLHRRGGALAHPFMDEEIGRLEAAQRRYERLRGRHGDKSPEWWWDTHGIAVDEMPR